MLKDTIFWLFGTAIVAFLDIPKATEEDGFFTKIVLDSVKLTVVLEFISNLFAFSVLVELLLLAMLAFIAAMAAVAETKTEFRPAERAAGWSDGCLRILLLIYPCGQRCDWTPTTLPPSSTSRTSWSPSF